MVRCWLRGNRYENFKPDKDEIWEDQLSKRFEPGDRFVLYITKGDKQYFLAGIYEYLGGFKIKPLMRLEEKDWIERPPLEEWKSLLLESLQQNTGFDIDGHKWVGRVASEGLELTEADYKKLEEKIRK